MARFLSCHTCAKPDANVVLEKAYGALARAEQAAGQSPSEASVDGSTPHPKAEGQTHG